jgi:hypothetical protein
MERSPSPGCRHPLPEGEGMKMVRLVARRNLQDSSCRFVGVAFGRDREMEQAEWDGEDLGR